MIPHARPHLAGNEARYLQECVETNYVSSVGPFVDRFERAVAEAAETPLAVATSSGTSALHVGLVALGVGPGDLVILPSFTFIASANAIAYCGATPWLVDVDPATWTIDVRLLSAALERETRRDGAALVHVPTGRRVAAVMPVHTLGMPADMDGLGAVAAAFGLPVIVDAAAAIGATYHDRAIGRLGAELSVISFNGNKTITAGGGGAVVGGNAELMRLVRHLSTTARAGEKYEHDRVGFNYRMTNLQAAVGCAQLERWQTMVAAKRHIRQRYDAAFRGVPGIELFPTAGERDSACWLSGILLSPPAPPVETICARLRERGIETRAFWRPVHLQPPYRDSPRLPMPVTESVWSHILTLPCSTDLSAADQAEVIAAVKEAVR